jgi:hypothetical protein
MTRCLKVLGFLGLILCLLPASAAAAAVRPSIIPLLAQAPRMASKAAARSVPSITESTRAHILAALARGDVAGAITAYEAHVGQRAPEWLRALQTAFSAKSQEVGRCQEVARILHTAFSNLGKTVEFIAIRANNMRQYMTFDAPDGRGLPVTKNGYHAAVKVGDMIYDAFTGPLGLKVQDYLARLNAPEGVAWQVVSSP